MNLTISKDITLEGCYRNIQIDLHYSKGDSNYDLIARLREQTTGLSRIWITIIVQGGRAVARGRELIKYVPPVGEALEEEGDSVANKGIQVSRKLPCRGSMVYDNPEAECAKNGVLFIGLPFHTLIRKIFWSIFISMPLKIISILGGRCKLVSGAEWRGLMPLRALVGLIAHPIISLLGLISKHSNYFNKLNGDLERWVNGHTDLDLETKSCAQRQHEAPYLAPCQQPLFKFKLPLTKRRVNVSKLTGDEQRLAFRALMGLKFGSARPTVQFR